MFQVFGTGNHPIQNGWSQLMMYTVTKYNFPSGIELGLGLELSMNL